MFLYRELYSEVGVLAVDQQAEGGQVGPQFSRLAAGRGQEGVVLQLLEGLVEVRATGLRCFRVNTI